MLEPRYLQPAALLAMGGHFYSLPDPNGGQPVSWCDTAADSWRLVPGKGYVRDNGLDSIDSPAVSKD